MKGYDVFSSDDHKLGTVVDVRNGNLIVEHGTLRKAKHAVPRVLGQVDEREKVVRLTISKSLFMDGPRVNGEIDERAVADHYGVSGGDPAPPTEGYGESVEGD